MSHVEGVSRFQRLLLAPSLEERIAADHPVRVIDAFVETLDLAALGFSKVAAEATGRPPYSPGALLKLYIYGYGQQLRSSRRLEREARRNIEVRWLLNEVEPSFKTIADFRRDHAASIVAVTRAFMRFCRTQQLYGAMLVAIDGTKLEAVASRKQVVTPKGLEKQMAGMDEKIARYLEALDAADRQEAAAEAGGSDVPAALEALRLERARIQAQAQALAAEGLSQKVTGEPEARLMKTSRHGHQVAYNGQTAVDDKHGLIAAFELTNECNDQCLLLPVAELAKSALEVETLTVVADTGYSNGEQGAACRRAGITAAVPRPVTVNPRSQELFSRDAFTYDAASDSWACPAGETLSLVRTSHTERKKDYRSKACPGCTLKPRCTAASARTISRGFDEADRDAMNQRTLADPRFMVRRRELAEHPFGIIKHMLGYPRFLLRGIKKASAEFALAVLGFNLKRAITIRGVPALLAALA